MSYFNDLQFLDLEDVCKEDVDEIHSILNPSRTPSSVVLPFIEQQVDWNQQSSYEGETSECSESGTECYQTTGPPPPQVACPPTSLHQVYPPPHGQVVPLPYLPPTAGYYHQQPPSSHQGYDGGRRRSKPSPKRSSGSGGSQSGAPTQGGGVPSQGGNTSVAPPSPYHSPLNPYSYHHPPLVAGPPPPAAQYQYMGGGMPAAQHAAGHPLFLTPQIPVYPPHLYSQYPPHQQVYSPPLHGAHPGGQQPQERSAKTDETTQVSPTQQMPPSDCTEVSTSTAGVQVSSQSVPVSSQQVPTPTLPPVNQMPPLSDIDVGMQRMVIHQATTGITTQVGVGQLQQGQQVLVPISTTTVPLQQHHHLPVQQQVHPSSGVTTPTTDIQDTESKAADNEEVSRVVSSCKSQPPLNAIKTTALPPSGAIKSNPVKPSSLPLTSPTGSVVKRKSDESETLSPTQTAPPASLPANNSVTAPLSNAQSPTANLVESNLQSGGSSPSGPASVLPTPPVPSSPSASFLQSKPGTWAGLFKNSSHPASVQSVSMHQSNNSLPTPVLPDPIQSAKVPTKMPKGPPSQNAVVLTPPPTHRGVAPTYSHHHHSSAPPPTSNLSSSITGNEPVQNKTPQTHPVANSQDPVLNRIAEVLADYELENRGVVLTPRGLNNPSNYCYINATLQALLACAPFYNLIKTLAKIKPISSSHSGPSSKSPTPAIDSMIQFVSEFSTAPNRLRKERSEKAQARREGGGVDQDPGVLPGSAFEPSYVYRMVHNSFSMLQHEARQEDAEEFLSGLLNRLHDEMLELLKLKGIGLSNGEVTTNGDSHPSDMDNSDWKEVINKGGSRVTRRADERRTPLSDIFRGKIRLRVERSDPQRSADNIDPFFCLPLDVESCNTVEEALAEMTSEKAVEGGNVDDQTTTASYIDHLPLVLILHLKCFHYSNGRLTKISKSLDFPIDLRLGSKLVQTNKSKQYTKGTIYKLFAVVYHDGKEATKGHYLADVYHVGSSCWIRYDDTQVKSVSEQQVLRPKSPRVPYLLLYRRMDKSNRS